MPNHINFISYSRKQQDKAIQIDTIKLKTFFWWMDYRIVGSVDWWQNICEAIEQSYCMIALMSHTYTESVYCMGELEYALKLNKPILCLMLEPGITYPKVLNDKNVQYVEVFDWDVTAVMTIILEAMHRVEFDYNHGKYTRDTSLRPYLRPSVPIPPPKTTSTEDKDIVAKMHHAQNTPQPQSLSVAEAIIQANYALDDEEFDRVLQLLEPVRPQAKDDDLEDIQELLREARLGQEYKKIAAFVQSSNANRRKRGCQRYRTFQQTYPDYPDAQDLAERCRVKVTEVLPPPFAWITIPAGDVTLITEKGWTENYIPEGESRTFQVPEFQIAKYPITNAQYRVFVQAGGYEKRQYWTDEGWQAKLAGWDYQSDKGWHESGIAWTQPRFWHDDKFNGDDKPVVGVSWYECVAFCNWLNETAPPPTGRIMLPTEQQWQRAAQGDDGREYPWGDDWDCQRCNNRVSPCNSNATTPVTQYEKLGASPYGVVDMAGNVWEWCLTAYETGETDVRGTNVRRVLRGGSWDFNNTNYFRVAFRDWNFPHYWFLNWGFRISLS